MATPSCRSPRGQTSKGKSAFAPRLVIMVKEPVAGRVKTRLARDTGCVRATAVYRAMMRDVAARLGCDRRWDTILAVSPDIACARTMLPKSFPTIPQGRGDLGQRLQSIFTRVPGGPVVVIGTDIPGITPQHIADAFGALGSHDAVLGPSPDGGYWLVGLARRPRLVSAFDRVRWSSAHALSDTVANLEGLRVARLSQLSDVDDASDLQCLAPLIGRRVLPVSSRKS